MDHSWVSGMMIVHPEDLEEVARMRAESGSTPPKCERCGVDYAGPETDEPCIS